MSAGQANFQEIMRICLMLTLILTVYEIPAAAAYNPERTVIIDQGVDLKFVPQEGFFLVDVGDGEIVRLTALLIPPYRQEPGANSLGVWLAGTRVAVPEKSTKISFSIILVGAQGQYAFVPPTDWNLAERDDFGGSVDRLRAKLLQRKSLLKSWQLQQKAQAENLSRLRADADIIAHAERLEQVRDQIEAGKLEIHSLQKDTERLKALIGLAKTKTRPKNYSRRQGELTRQVAELARAAKSAESQEYTRKSASDAKLQRQLTIIESTRFADLERLQIELEQQRARRARLERRYGRLPDDNENQADVLP